MSVEELIEKLKQCPKNAEVFIEIGGASYIPNYPDISNDGKTKVYISIN